MNKFNIEDQYQEYLKKMRLNEATMHPEQKRQLRQAFYGSWGQALICLRDDVGALPDNKAMAILISMEQQVNTFFQAEADRFRARNN